MPLAPYSTAAALVNAMTPAFAALYTLVGMSDAFRPPIDDQLMIDPPPVAGNRLDPVLGAEQHAAQVDVHDAVVLGHGDLVHRLRAADTGDVQHGVDASERLQRAANIASTLLSCVTSRGTTYRIAELGRGLVFTSTDVGREHLRTFADEPREDAPAIPDPAPVITATLPSSSPMVPLQSVASG